MALSVAPNRFELLNVEEQPTNACSGENDRNIAEAAYGTPRRCELPLHVFDQHRHALFTAEAHRNDQWAGLRRVTC